MLAIQSWVESEKCRKAGGPSEPVMLGTVFCGSSLGYVL